MIISINLTCYSNNLTTKTKLFHALKIQLSSKKSHVYEQPTYDTITTRIIHEIAIETWYKTEFQSIVHHTTQINKREKNLIGG